MFWQQFSASVGLSFLQFTNMNSMRSLFIVGVSFYLGLSIPEYFRQYTAGALHGPSHTKAGWVKFYESTKTTRILLLLYDLNMNLCLSCCPYCSSMIFWTRYSDLHQLLRWSLLCSLTIHLNSKKVQRTEECHGGPNSEVLKVIVATKSFILFLSISTASFLPRDWLRNRNWCRKPNMKHNQKTLRMS